MNQGDVTALLKDWHGGNNEAIHEIIPLIYNSLRQTARRCFSLERRGHTLQPTALINEVYMRLQNGKKLEFANRKHFLWFAGQMMRRILVDHARTRSRDKRGGASPILVVDDDEFIGREGIGSDTLLALDMALDKLEAMSSRQARIVELRFFAGLEVEEVAEVLEVSHRTVVREWQMARLWLARELGSP